MCKSPSCGKSATATDSPFWVNHNYSLPIVVAKVVEKQLYGSETDDLYTTTASNASYSTRTSIRTWPTTSLKLDVKHC